MTLFQELSEKERQALLYQSACRYLARREHSQLELKEKLTKKYPEASGDEVGAMLEFLIEKNFLSDTRYIKSFVEASVAKGYGPGKIGFLLRNKGVNLDELEPLLQVYNFRDIANELVNSRYKSDIAKIEPKDFLAKQKLKAKIHRFLFSRGFSAEINSELTHSLLN